MVARLYLTPRERAALLQAQDGKCACGCGKTPEDGLFEGDHSTPDALKRDQKPDQLLFWECHLRKTRKDVREIARAKRLAGETMSQWARRKKFGPTLKGNSQFPSRWRGR